MQKTANVGVMSVWVKKGLIKWAVEHLFLFCP